MVYKAHLEKPLTKTAVITTPQEFKPEMSASSATKLIAAKLAI